MYIWVSWQPKRSVYLLNSILLWALNDVCHYYKKKNKMTMLILFLNSQAYRARGQITHLFMHSKQVYNSSVFVLFFNCSMHSSVWLCFRKSCKRLPVPASAPTKQSSAGLLEQDTRSLVEKPNLDVLSWGLLELIMAERPSCCWAITHSTNRLVYGLNEGQLCGITVNPAILQRLEQNFYFRLELWFKIHWQQVFCYVVIFEMRKKLTKQNK